MSQVVWMPHIGEWGHYIMWYVRQVYRYPEEETVVCVQRGQECLFPRATGFFYDWENPIPDSSRCVKGSWGGTVDTRKWSADLRRKLVAKYPGFLVKDVPDECPWHLSDLVRFRPVVQHHLPTVDVAICPRRRAFASAKNYAHWQEVVYWLERWGCRVGSCGAKDTSFELRGVVQAWDHPGGATEGTVDLLSHCRIFLSSDTGVAHLAGMMGVPSILFRCPEPGNPDMRGMCARANTALHINLPDHHWHDKNKFLDTLHLLIGGAKWRSRNELATHDTDQRSSSPLLR